MKIMEKAAIIKAIESVARRGLKLDADIQEAAYSILVHVDKHGEVSLANQLYKAMPKGSRRNALVEFFIQCGKIGVNTDKATKGDFPLIFDKSRTTDLKSAEEKPWFNRKPEAAPDVAFNPDAFIAKIQAQLRKLSDKGELPADERLLSILAMKVAPANEQLTA